MSKLDARFIQKRKRSLSPAASPATIARCAARAGFSVSIWWKLVCFINLARTNKDVGNNWRIITLRSLSRNEGGAPIVLFPTYENRESYVNNHVIHRFETICKEIYLGKLGVVTDQLLKKHPKDRTAEDMSERVEQLFCENYPTKDDRRFVNELLRIWSRNADSSELSYFFRAHLLQALGEVTVPAEATK